MIGVVSTHGDERDVSARAHIVYLSFDGLLSPLGHSQVVRVVKRLADKKAHRFTICSLERGRDLADAHRVQGLVDELRASQILWRHDRYSEGRGAWDVGRNLARMQALVDEVVREKGADLLHARSYVAASVARRVWRRRQIPYLFDTRGFWVDERIEQGRWFCGPLRRKGARLWEKNLYDDAAAVVMLTEEAARQVRRRQSSSPWDRRRPVRVIPTCVDYGEFGLGGPGNAAGISEQEASKLDASVVVGYVGSVNEAYAIGASLRLFDHLLARRPDAHLLCLTRDPPALLKHLKGLRLPPETYTVTTATHDEMPAYYQKMDWGLLIRSETADQRAYVGAMPTKLAEFFATGVRPVYRGEHPEVRRWVEHAASGMVLDGLDEQQLRQAAAQMARTPRCVHTLWGARWRTRRHFGLEQGTQRYLELYDEILNAERSPARLRALFLTEGTTVPASRFRVHQLVPHLQRRGVDCVVRPAYGDGYNRWSQTRLGPLYKLACRLKRFGYLADAHRFDVVVVQRPALPYSALAERLASLRNSRLLFDVDDAIFTDAAGQIDARKLRAFQAIVERSAHVVCGNDNLARRTRHLAPTSVIPTVVDTEIYRPCASPAVDDGQVVVGWMGTPSNFDSLKMVVPLLRRIVDDDDEVRIRLVSSRPFAPLQGVDGVEQRLWSPEEEVELLQSFDIGLMPLVDNEITRGKCGFKAIQYMAVGIPVVASAVGANNQILQGQECGLLAEDVAQFDEALRRLLVDDQMRVRMGRAGRKRVERHYSVEAVIDRYVELLEALARQKSHVKPASRAQEVARRSSA